MEKKKGIIITTIVVLLLLVIGVTYAFFTYESGTKSDIVTGQIYMNYEETSTISLTGVFPETKAQALARNDENGVFEFTITGRNTSKYPVYYEIDLLEGGVITGKTETSTKILPEHVRIYLERDGEPLVDGMTFKDWNNRRIYVDTVPANQATNIEHKYTLRMWIDENVTISDTDPNADYTTTEWNDAYTSLKVRVVGDFEYKEASTDASCFAYNVIDDPTVITYNYPIITLDTSEEKVEACIAFNESFLGPEEEGNTVDVGETYEAFCNGTGTIWGMTLKEVIGAGTFNDEQIQSLGVVSDITYETRYYELNTSEESVNSCKEVMMNYAGSDKSDAGDGYQSFCEGTGTSNNLTIFDIYTTKDTSRAENMLAPYSLVEKNVFTQVEGLSQVIEVINYDETCGTDVIIPSTIEGLPVTRIADGTNYSSAFGSKGLTDIVIPNTMTYIGNFAFNKNPLVNVKINGNPVLGTSSFIAEDTNAFQTFQYGGTCAELNQYEYILIRLYKPQSIITSDTNNCVYNSYVAPR